MDDGSHQAKYKNSRSTRLFNKSYELYHLDQAKTSAKSNMKCISWKALWMSLRLIELG